MVSIDKLVPSDRAVWEDLFRAYIDFYHRTEPPEMERSWMTGLLGSLTSSSIRTRQGRMSAIYRISSQPLMYAAKVWRVH